MPKPQKFFEANLPVVFFKEDKKFVAYSPALDLSTCGDSFEHAQKRFDEAARLFLEELIKMGTLDEVLQECGWQKVSRPVPTWVPPAFVGKTQEHINVAYPV